ncbi:MAG: RecQ family ATP-dependent DNA helicase [Porphyromonas sp.]|nr:RecQ family ATP-dependent DNA helicase [Porphyromonas sp.]
MAKSATDQAAKLSPLDILRRYWGYDAFRPMQEDIIRSILDGYDTLALMPTGGGKSITFQVPALMLPGITVVITPLVALMRDQVNRLQTLKIKAEYLHAGMSSGKIMEALDNCLYGEYKLLYVSPERLMSETFLNRITRMNVSLLVVDESHCVCQWGYDFRPSYLKIADFRSYFPDVPILALTATATKEVVGDIQDKLMFRQPARLFQRSFYRKNLSYVVKPTVDKLSDLVNILESVPGSGLVYVRSRKKAKLYSDLLNDNGINSAYFHAGLSHDSKEKRQKAWMNNDVRIMVCTNAFGMGIDKEDVRIVVHPEIPTALEDYYQEAGRAARDNKPSYAVLLFDPTVDLSAVEKRVQSAFPPREKIKAIYGDIANFLQIAEGAGEGYLFELNISRFCHLFRHSVLEVHASLALLDIAGYLDFEVDQNMPSRVMITLSRQELYQVMDEASELHYRIVELLLRSYTGLFTEYSIIDESKLRAQLDMDADTFYAAMLHLNRWGVLDYIPGKRSSYIRYKRPRCLPENVHIPYESYEKRLQKERDRAEASIAYASTTNKRCRSQVLLDYFGETGSLPCGLCDVCRERKHSGLTFRIMEVILDFLSQASLPMSLSDIAQKLNAPEEYIRQSISFSNKEGNDITIRKDGMVVRERGKQG